MRLSNCALWSLVLVGMASAGATKAAQTAPFRMRGQLQQSQDLEYEPQNGTLPVSIAIGSAVGWLVWCRGAANHAQLSDLQD